MTTTIQIPTDWQWRQFLHDEIFHRDIAYLPTNRALNHFSQHLTKYGNRLQSDDEVVKEKATIDSLFITMAIANRLNVRILSFGVPIHFIDDHVSLGAVGTELIATLAKCMEAFDHLEDFAYRETFMSATKELFSICLRELHRKHSTNLEQVLMDRWVEIEKKSIFYRYLKHELNTRWGVWHHG